MTTSGNFAIFAPVLPVLLVLLAGCTSTSPTSSPPAAPLPVSSQTTILNADKLLADAVNAAVKAVIALRDQGKVSQSDTTEIENYCLPAARFSDALDTIVTTSAANGDTWDVERGKILSLLQATALPVISSAVSPTAAAVITQVVALITQIKGTVGL